LATHQKKALRQQAHLVLIDESGLLMAPLVKRTWAPRGQRPMLRQKGKQREKVSLVVALALSPRRLRLKLLYCTLINGYFNNEKVVGFLQAMMRDIPDRILVLWDRGNMHQGDPIRAQVARFYPRLSLELLPPWAPMLDPVEAIFNWLKYSQLSNYAPANAQELDARIHEALDTVADDQEALFNFWHESKLPLPKPLF
jgi:hypothetical protein